ncbi:MAG TPA: hypothetical protein VK524_34850 [Polyangiaceae bacterium]|nr:hypothetical protein [Polyangiaceae bacterium]
MTVEMGKDGMICKMMPMAAAMMDQMKSCYDMLCKMMGMGMPCMMTCGNCTMMCMPATG